ncbi:chaperone modulator CbpM [Azotobacter chroococcum]
MLPAGRGARREPDRDRRTRHRRSGRWQPRDWRFEPAALDRLRQALRLQRQLELDWPAVAVALDLLDEVARLRAENESLRRRLLRFMEP